MVSLHLSLSPSLCVARLDIIRSQIYGNCVSSCFSVSCRSLLSTHWSPICCLLKLWPVGQNPISQLEVASSSFKCVSHQNAMGNFHFYSLQLLRIFLSLSHSLLLSHRETLFRRLIAPQQKFDTILFPQSPISCPSILYPLFFSSHFRFTCDH